MATFGKRNNQRSSGTSEMWIKYFRDPRTLVWFLEDNPIEWMEYKQHFDINAKRGFPCAIHEGGNDCVGCAFPVEDPTDENDPGLRVRQTSSQFVVPVLDEKGYVSLYQMGYPLWADLKTAFEEYGTITDRQYAVRKVTEPGRKTKTTPTRTDNKDRPEIKVAVPGEREIGDILGKQYLEAMERYGYDPDGGEPVEPTLPERSGDVASEALAAAKTRADSKGVKAPDEAQATHESGEFDPDNAGMGELKDFLSSRQPPIEFPPRAGRPVLVGLAKQAMESDAPPF